MPIISQQKKDKIAEQILHFLFTISPEATFTNKIAAEIARDEEFTKSILKTLNEKSLVVNVTKNSSGVGYSRRQRWRLANHVYDAYSKHQ